MSFTANSKGGEYNHKLSVDEMPKHRHSPPIAIKNGGDAGYYRSIFATNSPFWQHDDNNATTYSGSNLPHHNIQPYFVVYYWERTQ